MIFIGNGYIPTSSLREILAALDDQLTPDQLNEMIAEIDTDASGTVDFDGKYEQNKSALRLFPQKRLRHSVPHFLPKLFKNPRWRAELNTAFSDPISVQIKKKYTALLCQSKIYYHGMSIDVVKV